MQALRQNISYAFRRCSKSPGLQGMLLTVVAIAIGLPVALAGAKFSAGFLYGIASHDVITFTLLPLFLAVVSLLACGIPARRAARVEPQVALHYE